MLGDNIRKYRKEKNMSQDELAERLDVTRQSVSLWENGQTQPSLENIIALSRLFGVSTDDLLTGDAGEGAPVAEKGAAELLPKKKTKKKWPLICLFACLAAAVGAALFFTLRGCAPEPSELPSEGAADSAAVSSETSGEALSSGASKVSEASETSQASELPSAVSDEPSSEAVSSEPVSEQVSEPATSEKVVTDPTSEKEEEPKKEEPPKEDLEKEEPKKEEPKKEDPPADKTSEKKEEPKKEEPIDLYGYLKEFVVEKGELHGDYCVYYHTADTYGGYADEDFSLYYWGDTDTVEFSLHCPLNETFSVNFYLQVPKTYSTTYGYISSYYYRDDGSPLYQAKGSIDASRFTKSYPLTCSKYVGSSEDQTAFMEISQEGICDLLDCLKQFIRVEGLRYSFAEFGFLKY